MVINRKRTGLFFGICAILLNLYSFYRHATIDFIAPTTDASIATIVWFISLIFLGVSVLLLSHSKKTEKNKNENLTSVEKVFFIGILIFGLILRLYKLGHMGLYLDEWYWLTNAKGILDGAIRSPFGFIGDQPSNMPAYIVALFLSLFKNSYFAVRFPGVLYSLLNIILLFSFLKEAFNKRVALIGTLLLSLSIWDIHMSQFGWNNVNVNPFLISGIMFFLYRGIKNLSIRDIFICGIFLGVSINLLYVASLSSIAVALYFLYHLLFNVEKKKIVYLLLFLVLIVFVVISPTIVKINKYPQQSIGRHKNFVSENITYSQNQQGSYYYLKQLELGFEDFLYKPEKFNIIGLWGIILEPIVFYFFIIGLLYSLRYAARPPFFLVLLNYIIMFIPIVVLYRFSSVWREFGFLPTIYILSSLGIYFIFKSISHLIGIFTSVRLEVSSRPLILTLILIIYFLSWSHFYTLYFDHHLKKDPQVYETYCKKTADYISKNIPPNTLTLLPNEMCKDLIAVVLWDKYRYGVYSNESDLEYLMQDNRKKTLYPSNVLGSQTTNGVIVQIADSNFSRNNTTHLKEIYTRYLFNRVIIEDNNIVYSYLYKF